MSEKNSVVHLTDSNFKSEVQDYQGVALVDFWAPWCAPCRSIAPIIESLAESYSQKAKIGKLNVDDEPQIPGNFGIRALPTMLVFKNGQVVDQIVGAVSKDKIAQTIDKYL